MVLIVCGCLLPMVIAMFVAARSNHAAPGDGARIASPSVHPMERWDAPTEEIALRGSRPHPRRRSDAALRRRHLAAVLPADARG